MTRWLSPLAVAGALAATPSLADHPGPFRVEGMSPLTTALITGAVAFAVALVVVVLVMVLTRPSADRSESDGE